MIYLASPYSHEDAGVREARYRVVVEVADKRRQSAWQRLDLVADVVAHLLEVVDDGEEEA